LYLCDKLSVVCAAEVTGGQGGRHSHVSVFEAYRFHGWGFIAFVTGGAHDVVDAPWGKGFVGVGRDGHDRERKMRKAWRRRVRANNIIMRYVESYKRSCKNCNSYFLICISKRDREPMPRGIVIDLTIEDYQLLQLQLRSLWCVDSKC